MPTFYSFYLGIVLTGLCFAQPETHQNLEEAPALKHPVVETSNESSQISSFQQCEQNVKNLIPKYLGRAKSQMSFHVMLACAGLNGDPIPRHGWKSHLPDCPATPPKSSHWKSDKPKFIGLFHKCADSCYRHSSKKSWKEIIAEEKSVMGSLAASIKKQYAWYNMIGSEDIEILNRHYPGQQCCYYRGQLITEGPGAGTPDVVFIDPNRTPKRLRPTGPLRAALFHDKFDVEIIKTRFQKWPKGWKDYWALGWSPVASLAPKFWGKDSRNQSCENFSN